jgi:hypothetical protein
VVSGSSLVVSDGGGLKAAFVILGDFSIQVPTLRNFGWNSNSAESNYFGLLMACVPLLLGWFVRLGQEGQKAEIPLFMASVDSK